MDLARSSEELDKYKFDISGHRVAAANLISFTLFAEVQPGDKSKRCEGTYIKSASKL